MARVGDPHVDHLTHAKVAWHEHQSVDFGRVPGGPADCDGLGAARIILNFSSSLDQHALDRTNQSAVLA